MVMKLKINRETLIGLSVLLVLLVTLGVVAARRFMRPKVPSEAAFVGQGKGRRARARNGGLLETGLGESCRQAR